MGKDLVGSSSGMKRMCDDEPIWELSLGSIYRGGVAATSSTPSSLNGVVTIAQALPLPRHFGAASVNLASHAPRVPPPGAALFAAGCQIASSVLDRGDGASTSVVVSLPLITSSRFHHVTPAAAAINLVAHVPVAAGAAFIAMGGTSPAQPPRASPPARPAHRPVRRRIANASPPQPGTVASASPAPFPWATNRVGIHHPISYLSALGITTVEGEVHCSRCDARKTVSYNIASKFQEIRDFVLRNVQEMDDRAPDAWLRPASQVPDCDGGCGQRNGLRPVVSPDKERINWVFLLLGQTLGLCTLEQLKFFCAHTGQHRTGAKDRVLFSVYMELCNQLRPERLFKLSSERRNTGQRYSS